ncbi:MAG: hypothetical protein Greene071421_92 [Parcubacteria group bacterium Greene0714_21]|nr:MAG: hypothetical protein Greene041639_259 [Parcubacteria group bacterium Greene0416_39]TSC97782.1 MAG: hypothetical protein Greene101447_318 [Parcubacteria group bacterium Greene1014_47]TSD04256.1 MAG: hypothetical protein Greene071421_92 [Parcubacteria group bacterium Greene0714_21]
MTEERFPIGMFVLIKLPGGYEHPMNFCPGIILADDEKDEQTKLVALSGGESQRIPTSALISVLQLEPEDFSRDPHSLLDRRPELKVAFWNVYGDVLRKVVAAG